MSETKGLENLSPAGIQKNFWLEHEARLTGMNDLTDLLWQVDSNGSIEEYLMSGGVDGMREFVGGQQLKELNAYDFTLKNKHVEGGLPIKPEDVRRDKTGQIMSRVAEFATVCADHPVELLGAVLNAAGSTKSLDGKNFYSTTHEQGDSGVWSNDVAAAQIAELNVADAENPTALELAKIIGKGIQWQLKYTNDRGRKMNGTARRFILVVPVNMVDAADQATRSLTLETGTGVVNNPRAGSMFSVKVVPNLDLTSTTQIHLFRVDGRLKPFIYQTEVPLKVDVDWEGSAWHKIHRQYRVSAEAWYNVGNGVPQYATRLTTS